jgi:hypothetical protein
MVFQWLLNLKKGVFNGVSIEKKIQEGHHHRAKFFFF